MDRLSLTSQGRIRYALKTPNRDGTTHVVFEPLDFMARLVALIPSPQVNLTRYHGVFAPNHPLRGKIVPGRAVTGEAESATQGPRHVSMGCDPVSIPRTSDSCSFQAALEVRG